METATHGRLAQDSPKPLSERRFGLAFAIWFLVIACWPLIHGTAPRSWALIASGALLAVAGFAPQLLKPLNRAFQRFGKLAGFILQTVVTALLFGLVFIPLGLLMRRGLREKMGFRWEAGRDSYWQTREAALPATDMRRQF